MPLGFATAEQAAFPLDVHPLDAPAADALAVTPDGAVLARPDAQLIAHWPTAPTDPPAQLAAVLASAWFDQPVGALAATAAGGGRR